MNEYMTAGGYEEDYDYGEEYLTVGGESFSPEDVEALLAYGGGEEYLTVGGEGFSPEDVEALLAYGGGEDYLTAGGEGDDIISLDTSRDYLGAYTGGGSMPNGISMSSLGETFANENRITDVF